MSLPKGTAQTVTIPLKDLNGQAVTGAVLITMISKDGAAYVATTNSAVEKAYGDYSLLLTAAERTCDELRLIATDGVTGTKMTFYPSAKEDEILDVLGTPAGVSLSADIAALVTTVASGIPTYEAFDSFTMVAGVARTGSIGSVSSNDAVYLEVGEHATNGLEVIFDITASDIESVPNLLEWNGRYNSNNAAHSITIAPWNYTTGAWETSPAHLATMTARTSDFAYSMPVSNEHQDPVTGAMRVRMLHNTVAFMTAHYLAIDSIRVSKVATTNAMAQQVAAILALSQDIDDEVDTLVSRNVPLDSAATQAAAEAALNAYDAATPSDIPSVSEIAVGVESVLIDEGDATALLQAIADKIANDLTAGDLTALAIASAVRTNLAAELARIDAAISSRIAEGNVTVGGYAPGATPAMVSDLPSEPDNAGIAAIQERTDNLPDDPVGISDMGDIVATGVVDAIETALSPHGGAILTRGDGSETYTDFVTDSNRGVRGALVKAFVDDPVSGIDWTRIVGMDMTEEDGSFILFLDPGDYVLSIEKNGIQLKVSEITVPAPAPGL